MPVPETIILAPALVKLDTLSDLIPPSTCIGILRLFINSYKSKYGRIPSEFAVQGYDSGKVIIEALKSLSGDISNKDELDEAITLLSEHPGCSWKRDTLQYYIRQTYWK